MFRRIWNVKQAVGLHCIQWCRRGSKLNNPSMNWLFLTQMVGEKHGAVMHFHIMSNAVPPVMQK